MSGVEQSRKCLTFMVYDLAIECEAYWFISTQQFIQLTYYLALCADLSLGSSFILISKHFWSLTAKWPCSILLNI